MPDVQVENLEIGQLRQAVRERTSAMRARRGLPQLSLPSVRHTPIDEFDRSQCIFRCAFPYLYRQGKADFHNSRLRSIRLPEYIQHAMRWHNGRFATHPIFAFMAHNKFVRQQIRSRSSFYVSRMNDDPLPIGEWRKFDRPLTMIALNLVAFGSQLCVRVLRFKVCVNSGPIHLFSYG